MQPTETPPGGPAAPEPVHVRNGARSAPSPDAERGAPSLLNSGTQKRETRKTEWLQPPRGDSSSPRAYARVAAGLASPSLPGVLGDCKVAPAGQDNVLPGVTDGYKGAQAGIGLATGLEFSARSRATPGRKTAPGRTRRRFGLLEKSEEPRLGRLGHSRHFGTYPESLRSAKERDQLTSGVTRGTRANGGVADQRPEGRSASRAPVASRLPPPTRPANWVPPTLACSSEYRD